LKARIFNFAGQPVPVRSEVETDPQKNKAAPQLWFLEKKYSE
jgi:hypothetical protein